MARHEMSAALMARRRSRVDQLRVLYTRRAALIDRPR